MFSLYPALAYLIEPYENETGFYIKSFLADDQFNSNGWRIDRAALARDHGSFVGQKFVLLAKADGSGGYYDYIHPEFEVQEQYGHGTIIKTGFDEATGKAWFEAKIEDPAGIELIKSGKIKYISPGLTATRWIEHEDGRKTITAFAGEHVAGVTRPAYGKYKAQIKGQCSGKYGECRQHLMHVQACAGCRSAMVAIDSLQQITDETIKERVQDLQQQIIEKNQLKQQLEQQLKQDPANEALSQELQRVETDLQYLVMDYLRMQQDFSATSTTTSLNDKLATSRSDMAGQADNSNSNNNAAEQLAQLTAQLKELSDKVSHYEAKSAEDQKTIASLKASLDAATKKPLVERIIAAKVELGKIKAEATATEAEALMKRSEEDLKFLASELESYAKDRKETMATLPPQYRRHFSASEDGGNGSADEKAGDKFMLRMRRGD